MTIDLPDIGPIGCDVDPDLGFDFDLEGVTCGCAATRASAGLGVVRLGGPLLAGLVALLRRRRSLDRLEPRPRAR